MPKKSIHYQQKLSSNDLKNFIFLFKNDQSKNKKERISIHNLLDYKNEKKGGLRQTVLCCFIFLNILLN
jgi:hypothetical protein